MLNETTILMGQALQLRDKLSAKRHHISAELAGQWSQLAQQVSTFDAAQHFTPKQRNQGYVKPSLNHIDAPQLVELVHKLESLDEQVTAAIVTH